jgi:hypothetical protein
VRVSLQPLRFFRTRPLHAVRDASACDPKSFHPRKRSCNLPRRPSKTACLVVRLKLSSSRAADGHRLGRQQSRRSMDSAKAVIR